MAKKIDDTVKPKSEPKKSAKPRSEKPAKLAAPKEKKTAADGVQKTKAPRPVRTEVSEHPLVGAVFEDEPAPPLAEAVAQSEVAPKTNGAKVKPAAIYERAESLVTIEISTEQIADRAWQIWQREGCPEGRDLEHWLQAEKELRGLQ